MSKKSAYLLGILLTIGIGTWLYNMLCCSSCCNTATTEDQPVTAVASVPESVFALNGKNIDYQCNKNFNFTNSDFKYSTPVDGCVDEGIAKLKTALETSGQKFVITGYALSTEKNTSVYENLGVARAMDVKNYFVSKGIAADLIETKGEVKEVLTEKDNIIYGPVDYTFQDLAANAPQEDWAALKEKINANPLIIYFNTNQTEIELSEEDRKKVTDIVNYLNHVADAKLQVTGHTDNVGMRDVNIKLGQGRANFAKNYLIKNDIAADKIISNSKGPDQPIADNATEEGKAKNRRTEIKIN
jgi:OmpA-OmpF porin, OOP family